nr:putative wax ester synthase/acyl-CoA:diacylglycerol acyltransferase [uncultured bacterium]
MAHPSTTDRLNPTDATLWQIQRDPLLRTTIVGLALLDHQPAWDELTATVERAIDRLPRLRQRVVDGPLGFGRPHWADTDIDLDHHLIRRNIDDAGDLRSLLDVVGELASDDLDLARPLWQLHLIEDDKNAAALVFKLSHTLTDGVGGMGLLRIFDDRSAPAVAASDHHTVSPPKRAASQELLSAVANAGRHPLDMTSDALSLVDSAARLMAPAGPPLSPLMTGRGTERWAGATEAPLDRLRAAAHRAGGTVNDAFVTIAIGALHDYHRHHEQPAEAFRVTMPVSIRSQSDEDGGNQWAPARLVLRPSPAAHPFVALHAHRSTIAKAVHEPAIPFIQPIAAAVQQLPDDWTIGIVANMVKGSDLVLTNVPGLREPLMIAGATVDRFYPFAPTGGAAVNIGLVSHLDTACVGFTVDTSAVADPETLVALFDQHCTDFLRRRAPRATAALDETATNQTTQPDSSPVDGSGYQRLSALDTSFLRMETPATPMHMGGLFVLDGSLLLDAAGRLDIEAIRHHIEDRLRAAPHLRRRLNEVPLGLGRPVWVDDPQFDIAKHVHRQTLAAPGGRAQLIEACEHQQMITLDRRRALFELTFFDGLDPDEFGPGAIALIDRVHHALLDGVSGLEMAQLIFDSTATPSPGPDRGVGHGVGHDLGHGVGHGVGHPPPSSLRLTTETIIDRLGEPLSLARETVRLIASPRRTRDLAAAVAASANNLLVHGAGPAGFNAPVGRHRRLLTLDVPLDDVHEVGAQLGGSINDVLLTAVAGGVSSVLGSRGEDQSESLNVLVPVSTRQRGLTEEEGNQVAALVVGVPLGQNVGDTFEIVAARMERLKRRGTARGSEAILDAGDLLAPAAIDAVARAARFQRSVNMVVTNIRGPAAPLALLGGEVRELVPIVPLGANLTVGLAIVSYNGTLTLSFHADRDRWPDLDVITDGVAVALDQLAALAAARTTSGRGR